MTQNMITSMVAMNKLVFFAMNYPYNFIKKIWGGTYLENHLKGKFDSLYDRHGSTGVMMAFYCELDGSNKKKLLEFILENFENEQRLHLEEPED